MTTTRLTDSQIAAHAAAQALNERRYALAEAFARIARIALAHEEADALAAELAAASITRDDLSDALDDGRFDAQVEAEQARLDQIGTDLREAAVAAARTVATNSFAAQLDADATAIGSVPAVVIPEQPAKLSDEQAWEQSQNQQATTSRCRQEQADPGSDGSVSRHFCDLAIYLGPDQVWRHVHLSLDHPAVPPRWWGAKPQYRTTYANPSADMSRGNR